MTISERRALALTALLALEPGCAWRHREKRIREPVIADYPAASPAFSRSAGQMLGAPLVAGNSVVELKNGDAIFASMVEAIRGAKRTITMEKYIWSSGEVSDLFVDALCERAKAGVRVLVIVDRLGGIALKKRDRERMLRAGVELEIYNTSLINLNHRTHRKILVVDGRVGFAGGVCVSDDWKGNAEPPHWRETHVRVEGPVVRQMQAVFADNWMQVRSEALHGDAFFPDIPEAGTMTAQFIKTGPREGAENARLSFLLSIAAARKNIRIAHAYFLPDTLMIDTLLEARRRGVHVEVIVPGKIDNILVQKAARPRWKKLLEAGVEFHEYRKTLYHCKIMVVDDRWSMVGSVNIDERSMKLNDEANLNVLDEAFAAKLIASFEADKAVSSRLTARDLKRGGLLGRFMNHVAGLFRPLL
jgi:cardiolipin synthase